LDSAQKNSRNLYNDINEYISWAVTRVETLFYQYINDETPTFLKIKYIDKQLIGTFPFLYRMTDRTMILDKFIECLKEFEDDIKHPKIQLNQSVHNLRKIANDLGIKNAFLLTKKQLQEELTEYNNLNK
jgi:two-component SAPR family response regulator